MNSLQGSVNVVDNGALLLAAMEANLEAEQNELQTEEGSPMQQPALILGTNAPVPSNFPKPENSASITGTVETAQEIAKIVEQGTKAGREVAYTLKHGDTTQRKIVSETAISFIGRPQTEVDDWLKGYGIGLQDYLEAGYAKTMKSETKRVIAAFAVKEVVLIDGMNDDKSPKKVKKTGREVMESFKGSYGKWVTVARDIVNGAPNRSTGTGPKKLTETGEKHVKDLIKVAKQDQAAEIASEAIQKLSGPAQCLMVEKVIPKLSNAEGAVIANQALDAMVAGYPDGWEEPLVVQAENVAQMLHESKDEAYQLLALEIDNAIQKHFAARTMAVTSKDDVAEAIATVSKQE